MLSRRDGHARRNVKLPSVLVPGFCVARRYRVSPYVEIFSSQVYDAVISVHESLRQQVGAEISTQLKKVISGAASGGRLCVLMWVRSHGCPWWHTRNTLRRHLGALQWARSSGCL